MSNFAELSGGDGDAAKFLMRWRGRQEGPHSASVIEAKLVANEIGMLHEIFHNGQWVTIRKYIAEREAALQAERQDRDERERRAREEVEKMARERDEQLRTATLAEEKRKNDLLAAGLARQNYQGNVSIGSQLPLKAHRGGLILTLGLIGLFICGPLALAAWIMGSSDLHEMDAGIMDQSGRSNTSTGKNCGIIGTFLWIIGFVIYLAAS
jgi:hypothetical protein